MLLLPLHDTLHNTSPYTVHAVLDDVIVCVCPQDGWTALHLAAHEGKVDVVRLLTESNAEVNMQTEVDMYTVMECVFY